MRLSRNRQSSAPPPPTAGLRTHALADGHAQIAWISMFHDWDWKVAERSLARAIELAPDNASVLRLSGVLQSIVGRPEKAIVILRRALEHDPLNAAAYHSLGLALNAVDDFAGAEEAFRKALELAPQRIGTHAQLALTCLARSQRDEALAEATREPEQGYRLWALAIVHRALSNAPESEAALRQLVGSTVIHGPFRSPKYTRSR